MLSVFPFGGSNTRHKIHEVLQAKPSQLRAMRPNERCMLSFVCGGLALWVRVH